VHLLLERNERDGFPEVSRRFVNYETREIRERRAIIPSHSSFRVVRAFRSSPHL
jgi:hypothetical protein